MADLDVDIEELRRLAEAAESDTRCSSPVQDAFLDAVGPTTIIKLLDKLQWYKDSFLRGFDNLMVVNKARSDRDESATHRHDMANRAMVLMAQTELWKRAAESGRASDLQRAREFEAAIDVEHE